MSNASPCAVTLLACMLTCVACEATKERVPRAINPSSAVQPLIELGLGETCSIALPAHGGTGYEWAPVLAEPSSLDIAVRERGSQPLHPGRVGGDVEWRFDLTALQAGRGTLKFELRRPWEPAAAPAETVTIPYLILRADAR